MGRRPAPARQLGPVVSSDGLEFTRPGPAQIDAGQAVGGIVVHIYSVPDCDLLHVGKLGGFLSPAEVIDAITDDVAVAAEAVQDHVEVCIVMYDGDDGRRLCHWPSPWN